MGVTGQSKQRPTTNGTAKMMPAWSSDGTEIAFISAETGQESGFDIYTLHIDTLQANRITYNEFLERACFVAHCNSLRSTR